jgi:membrane fusion protein (multidrug efflux system)
MNEPSLPQSVQPGVTTAPPPAAAKPDKSKVARIIVWIIAVIAVVGLVAYFYLPGFFEEETDDAYVEGHVVSISPKVPAYAAKLHIDDNTRVNAGDLLVELDPRDYVAAADIARANLNEARDRLAEAQKAVVVAQANAGEAKAELGVAQANAILAQADLKRFHAVSDSRAVSSERIDRAQAAADGTRAAVEAAEMKVRATASTLELNVAQTATAESAAEQASAVLDQAQLNLSYVKIFAPVSGTVASKGVEEGNYVQPGDQLFSIVPNDLYIVANYKETQLKRMRPGQEAVIHVDAFPGADLRGHIDSFQRGTGSRFALLPPENATGNFVKVVQRIPVKIILDEPATNLPYLSAGMSVEAKVYFHRRDDGRN